MSKSLRRERDFLGEMEIPEAGYYGIQTARALNNFQITGTSISRAPEMIRALALVKKAACLANYEHGVLPEEIARAIAAACDEIADGKLHDQFVVDPIQGGAGTSTNMNANEVIANRALELLGHQKGEYDTIHPNNHVNCSQSTNDVYPTALRLALSTREINLGATAIGTAINTPSGYARTAVGHLRRLSGIEFVLSPNLIEATWDTGAYVQVSGVLKRYAIKLSKICNDLRLLSSGPRAGLNEINLPKLQPGSSIMPGKVNPVIPELVNQVAYLVVGADATIAMASENGQLQLNVMEPVIAHCLFSSIEYIGRASLALADKCVIGITANRKHCREMVDNSIGIVTALNPILGYELSCRIAREALQNDCSVVEVVLRENLLEKDELDRALSIDNMVHRHVSDSGSYREGATPEESGVARGHHFSSTDKL